MDRLSLLANISEPRSSIYRRNYLAPELSAPTTKAVMPDSMHKAGKRQQANKRITAWLAVVTPDTSSAASYLESDY
jgi:hypothetical protein